MVWMDGSSGVGLGIVSSVFRGSESPAIRTNLLSSGAQPRMSARARGPRALARSGCQRGLGFGGRGNLVASRGFSRTHGQLVPILSPQDECEHQRPNGDRGIRDVERPEPYVTDADVDEVDDTLRRAEPVEKIAGRAARREPQRENSHQVARRRDTVQAPQDDDRDY